MLASTYFGLDLATAESHPDSNLMTAVDKTELQKMLYHPHAF